MELKPSAKGTIASSARRAPSKKPFSNKTARKMDFLNVLPSGISRGSPIPAYRFRRPN